MFGLAQHAMPASSTPLKMLFTESFGAGCLMGGLSNIIPRLSGNFLTGAGFSRRAENCPGHKRRGGRPTAGFPVLTQ
jgi:hypothetical protein